MKKTFSLILCLLMLCSLSGMAACKKNNDGKSDAAVTPADADELLSMITDEMTTGDPAQTAMITGTDAEAYLGGEERFFLTADQETVAPGGTFTVTFRAEHCVNVACFDLLVATPEGCAVADCAEKEIGDFIMTVSQVTGGVNGTAIVATAADIDALEMMTVTFTVPQTAVSGDKITVEAAFTQFLVGTDGTGDRVADATAFMEVQPVTLTVA